ncbi:Zinc finger CCCH domain-containing protein 10 [Monoraphidium neglectum]|uniref:Zinc finger CCCH domain-containing protein 10 n=1 Tax=Monoraphidium neglectum TaxID=145388 RepID=A0A0D2NQ16_9CHLO|nr:Zinc finger CCCH domain-containing protein 10 [Monoraphidium neglectum]KIZ06466.1 Zinc finger CCCH domain-containing protein 10 [Monoraphidium neglectum]|eukprot:XP_013905485.1 Zinc finger CCCH domain-containing protein 10 [Monoraphidium neglectum]
MCYLGFPAAGPAASPPDQTHLQAQVVDCDNPDHGRDDWDACPFAHAGEVVTRRPPQTHLPKLCPKARRACRKGRSCPYAHNVFEHWLHPSRFKTEICQHGSACGRPMCFFAHYQHEVRHPSPSADDVMAAAEAAGLLGRPHAHGGCGGCGGRCSDDCYDGGMGMGDGFGHQGGSQGYCAPAPAPVAAPAPAPWLAPPGLAACVPAAPLQQQQQAMPQQQLLGQFEPDASFAAQCLQAQPPGGWSVSDWSVLSSGNSSPSYIATPAAPTGSPAGGFPPAALGAPAGGLLRTAAYGLWDGAAPAPAQAQAPAPRACGFGAPGVGVLSSEDALCLLVSGLNVGLQAGSGPTALASDYLWALQAEQGHSHGLATFY